MTISETVSETILNRLDINNIPFFANDNISKYITKEEKIELEKEVTEKVDSLLRSLLIDIDNDHNTKGTSKRIAKMFIHETMKGRFEAPPKITTFPNVKELDELVITKAKVNSLCSHHFQNIIGTAYIGILYGDKVMGLSKFHRIVSYFSNRPQIQEELVVQIADFIEEIIKPKGLAIIIKADHMCVQCRGVEQDSFMTTSVMRGEMRNNAYLKSEFLKLIDLSEK